MVSVIVRYCVLLFGVMCCCASLLGVAYVVVVPGVVVGVVVCCFVLMVRWLMLLVVVLSFDDVRDLFVCGACSLLVGLLPVVCCLVCGIGI